MPIEIRSRCTSIADALVAFFKDPRQPNLRGFSLSSLTDEVVREHVKEHLETTDSGGVESWGDIFGVLKDAEVPDEDLKRLKRGWTRWVEADEQKLVRVVRWGGDFPLDTSLSGSSQVAEGLSSSTGHEWLLWVDEHRSYRSTVDIQLTHWRQEATDPAALGDLAAIEAWFNEGYNQAIATQHGCGQFEAIGSSPSYTRAAEEEVRGRWSQCSAVYLDLPPEFILGLGSLPDGSFTESVFRERQNLRAWWEQGDADSLRRALEPLVDLVFNSDLVAKPLGAMLRESLATAVARAAAARVLAHPLVPPGIVGEATVSGSLLAAAAAPEVVKYMRLGSPVRGKASETLRRAMQIAEER